MVNSTYRMDAGLEHLIRLQKVDEQIAQLLHSIAELPKHLASLEDKLRSHRASIDEAEKAIAAEEARRRRLDSDLKDAQQKVLKYRGQTSSVKTNDEFRALQHEIDFAEAEITKIDDQQLQIMEKVEAFQASRNAATASFAEQQVLVEQEKTSARATAAEQQAKLAELKNEREQHRKEIDASVLQTYDRVSASSRKTGLARVQGQRCLACQMYLRPQIWNQVRSGQLLTCESCARLLYFDPSLEPPPPPPVVPVKKKRTPKATAPLDAAQEVTAPAQE
jgi:predicted  nucleic acid-binding Zn-ribbon protein